MQSCGEMSFTAILYFCYVFMVHLMVPLLAHYMALNGRMCKKQLWLNLLSYNLSGRVGLKHTNLRVASL
jgi:hypothetical protein